MNDPKAVRGKALPWAQKTVQDMFDQRPAVYIQFTRERLTALLTVAYERGYLERILEAAGPKAGAQGVPERGADPHGGHQDRAAASGAGEA